MPTTTTAPRHTNRLAQATSPYLLQHAHNPVDWYEWGEEALARAKREDRPIFLSIGYSACHWCHVMERESFEKEAIAAILNEHFVSIKVDREERPDLDDVYMKATMLYNRGQGGWPMSVFLTPDLKPFFAGTYFPPETRWGRPGFADLLRQIAALWKEDRQRIAAGAESLTDAVRRFAAVEPGKGIIPHEALARCAAMLAGAFDSIRGGLTSGGTNKFPPSMAMDVMLRVYHMSLAPDEDGKIEPRKNLLDLVTVTLDRMAHGGIYDQLGGGIARYSTDEEWLVPHFEKMLYDQALVAGIYLDAYVLTGRDLYARMARDICEYVLTDLQSPEGGFFSARDADSEGVEGKFYVWSKAEIVDALGADEAELVCSYYDVSEAGNWEGHNILHVPRSAEAVARMHGIPEADLNARIAVARKKLLAVRGRRVPPHRDDKVLASWNGLMIGTLARASRILEEPRFGEAAARAADFILSNMVRDGRLMRSWRQGRVQIGGYLDDYAFLIEALLNLYEATFETRWLDAAERLNEGVRRHFRDDEAGGFYFTPDDVAAALVRFKDAHDGAVPAGNSVQLMNLLRLSVIRDRKDLAAEAEAALRCFSAAVEANPASAERMLAAADFYHRRPREIVLIAPRPGEDLKRLVSVAWRTYVPNRVIVGALEADLPAAAKKVPLLAERKALGGRATAYVCENFVCKSPTTEPEALRKQLSP